LENNMDPDQAFELAVYRRDGWRCIWCRSSVDVRVYRHGDDLADIRSYATYCARCVKQSHL
jgi:hypothetical protein